MNWMIESGELLRKELTGKGIAHHAAGVVENRDIYKKTV